MKTEKSTIICSGCDDPFHILMTERGKLSLHAICPYCSVLNLCPREAHFRVFQIPPALRLHCKRVAVMKSE